MTTKKPPRAPAVRFKIEPAYATAEKIARLLCLTPGEFHAAQARLYARGFPVPDETTGRYDIEAVERWRKRQRPDLYPELTLPPPAVEDPKPKMDMGDRFAQAQEERRSEIQSSGAASRGSQGRRPSVLKPKTP